MHMPMQITSPDGTVLYVRTHVGQGITVVEVWEELPPQHDDGIDSQGDGE